MDLCVSSIGVLDVAVFLGWICLTGVTLFAGVSLGGLLARLVPLERLEVMAKKPKGPSLLGMCLFFLGMIVAAGIAVAMGVTLKQLDHLSANVNATISVCAFGLLMGLCLGTDTKVRERVNLVRTDYRGLLEYF